MGGIQWCKRVPCTSPDARKVLRHRTVSFDIGAYLIWFVAHRLNASDLLAHIDEKFVQ